MCGSESASATFDNQRALIVERFDREWMEDGKRIIRLPQEDLCQALGMPPAPEI